ncbi:hypothetical protein MW887_007014 [Aspergillus wentii]|nr:hypothetical protein MW887_007014 [Aspergillus wentii]
MPFQSVFNDGTICIICGLEIIRSWRAYRSCHSEFKAVYQAPDGVKLTGVGSVKHDHHLRPPTNPAVRWDTMGEDSILLKDPPHPIPGVYLFHARCWDSFMDHIGSEKFDLASLYDALEYLPVPEGPWYHDVVEPRGPGHDGYDPFILPTLEQLMQSPKAPPRLSNDVSQRLAAIHQNPTDCFRLFPLEICKAIAFQLPTQVLLSLRHVSRVMIPIFTSTAFWRTRFAINGERGSLHPVAQKSPTRKTGEKNA